MNIFTIGFTKTSADNFFGRIERSGARSLVDVRLNNQSQLAGFAKNLDLKFFLDRLLNVSYRHESELAPTQEMLSAYRKKEMSWSEYEAEYLALLNTRDIASKFQTEDFENACLLCSEDTAHMCHRRLLAEYLTKNWSGVKIIHL